MVDLVPHKKVIEVRRLAHMVNKHRWTALRVEALPRYERQTIISVIY